MSYLGEQKAAPLTRRSFTALLGIGISVLGGWIKNGMAGGLAPPAVASFSFGTLIDLGDLDTVLRTANWKLA